jgi:hypothetical protein
MGSIFERYRDRKDLEPTKEENRIIEEVKEYIKQKYHPVKPLPNTFRIFKPLTSDWKKEFSFNKGYCWGSHIPDVDIILLTKCRNTLAFYEVVFHELFEWLFNRNNTKIISEERKYLEEKFRIKLGNREWSPLEDEIIQTLYPLEKDRLRNTFANMPEPFRRTRRELEQRAKELGLICIDQ